MSSGPSLADTHAHLDLPVYDKDREQAVRRSRQAGVELILNMGTDLKSSRASISLAERYDDVYAAVGIHPFYVGGTTATDAASLAQMAAHPKVVAIGEIGLDFHGNHTTREDQAWAFCWQLDLAGQLDLPVMIHCRDAHHETLEMLKACFGNGGADKLRGAVHGFSGDVELARRYLELGFYISIAGSVTYPKANGLAEAVREVPEEALLAETDCPFMTPRPFVRRRRNEPAHVHMVVQRLAEIKGVSVEIVARQTTDNARRLLRLPCS